MKRVSQETDRFLVSVSRQVNNGRTKWNWKVELVMVSRKGRKNFNKNLKPIILFDNQLTYSANKLLLISSSGTIKYGLPALTQIKNGANSRTNSPLILYLSMKQTLKKSSNYQNQRITLSSQSVIANAISNFQLRAMLKRKDIGSKS